MTSADTTLYEWLYKWLDRYCINIRDSTRMNYVTYIERHIRQHRIASIPLKHLTTDDIQGYIAFLKKAEDCPETADLVRKPYGTYSKC